MTGLFDAFMTEFARPDIICDTDDTLCFEAEELISIANAMFGFNLELAILTDYHPLTFPKGVGANKWLKNWRNDPRCYVNHAPDYDAIAGIGALRDAGYHVTVSSDRPATMEQVSRNWYAQWQVPYDEMVIAGPGSKAMLCGQHSADNPCILIDDNPNNASLARPGVQVWIPYRPWTPAGLDGAYVWVFHSWRELLARLGVMMGTANQ